ncbi:YHS domain-containing (seleno)protein [Paracoccus sp. CPCC 101403]|uniref:YHS domain-containing (Seleno)protein n=2 Tax=Paracoccus broussonetiae TaxID=3075834 RepID=A0ABU3ECJ8_9RHOB|nr:YHS domain-containing (seleno)protein [Paracoccus sp. CPCC 101403]MDT1061870.1 YHS domain-containing (seleno)protein [Paracoccus sp. CPCC 101403]
MIRTIALLLSLTFASHAAQAQDWALDGMDPVSYSREGAAIPGRSDIVTMWRGKSWHFATEDNRTAFEANPRAFAPGLGGLCVVALSEGRSEPGNPRYFAVIGQRTYLLRSEAARRRLLADPQHVLMQAKAVWARLHP